MLEYSLNILGSEWIIIIFVAIFALLGTNKLPEISRKIGKAVGEYNRTKNEIQGKLSGASNLNVTAPVQNERQKLEFIAKSLGVDFAGKTDDELKKIIASKMSADTKG
jgi:sec-independent protein translocase protein TatA